MLIPLGTWRVNGHLDVVPTFPWLSMYTKFSFAENGNLSLPVLSTERVRKITRTVLFSAIYTVVFYYITYSLTAD